MDVQEQLAHARNLLIKDTATLTGARTALAQARCVLAQRERDADEARITRRQRCYRMNLVEGKNETERRSWIDDYLLRDDPCITTATAAATARDALEDAQANYDNAYRRQQADRVIIAALTALVGGERA